MKDAHLAEPTDRGSHVPRRRLALQVGAALALIWTCWALAQTWAGRHPRRWLLPAAPAPTLSAQSGQVLAELRQPVQIWVFTPADWPHRRALRDLLDLARYGSRWIAVDWVDPWLDPARVGPLAERLGVREGVALVLESAGRVERIGADSLLRHSAPEENGAGPQFCGEQALLEALLALTAPRPWRVAFVTGHGERGVDDYTAGRGLADFARALRRQALEVVGLPMSDIAIGEGAPDLLVIAAPSRPWEAQELDGLRAYLDTGGRCLALAETGFPQDLAAWVQEWDLFLEEGQIEQPQKPFEDFFDTASVLRLSAYPRHPVTGSLQGLQTTFYGVRPVSVRSGPEETGAAAEPAPEREPPQIVLVAPPGARLGAGGAAAGAGRGESTIVFAAVAERGRIPQVEVGLGKVRRVMVIGDCDFLANGRLAGGNLDLGLNAVNWLLGREALLARRPAEPIRSLAPLSGRQQIELLGRGVFAPILGILALGAAVAFTRR